MVYNIQIYYILYRYIIYYADIVYTLCKRTCCVKPVRASRLWLHLNSSTGTNDKVSVLYMYEPQSAPARGTHCREAHPCGQCPLGQPYMSPLPGFCQGPLGFRCPSLSTAEAVMACPLRTPTPQRPIFFFFLLFYDMVYINEKT